MRHTSNHAVKKRGGLKPVFLGAVHCGLPLLAGGFVYLFLRPPTRLSRFFKIAYNPQPLHPFIQAFANVIPDFCWGYSLAFALYLTSSFQQSQVKKTQVVIFLVLMVSELMQVFAASYFTFDFYDLLALVAAFVCATLQSKRLLYETKAI